MRNSIYSMNICAEFTYLQYADERKDTDGISNQSKGIMGMSGTVRTTISEDGVLLRTIWGKYFMDVWGGQGASGAVKGNGRAAPWNQKTPKNVLMYWIKYATSHY